LQQKLKELLAKKKILEAVRGEFDDEIIDKKLAKSW
jgi:predicted RNA binding protein with dsRBD fold (UPF0201 family)